MGELNRYSEYKDCMRQAQKLRDLWSRVRQLRIIASENGNLNPLGYLSGSEGAAGYLKAALVLLDGGQSGWAGDAKTSCQKAVSRMRGQADDLAYEWRDVCDDLCNIIEQERLEYAAKADRLVQEFNALNAGAYYLDDFLDGKSERDRWK